MAYLPRTDAPSAPRTAGELPRWAGQFSQWIVQELRRIGQSQVDWHNLVKATGGTVVQATSKSTGVTLNFHTGQITLNAASLAANTTVSFVLTNSKLLVGDQLLLSHDATGSFASYNLNARRCTVAGVMTIDIRNITAGALAEAIVLGFTRIPGATS